LIAQFIPNPFAPIPLDLVPWLFFAAVFVAVSLSTFIVFSILGRFEPLKSLKVGGITAVIAAAVGGIAVWLCWPTLHDYRVVTTIAKPGANISAVIKQFGEPSEHYVLADGSHCYLYAEGIMTGFTSIDTDPNGVIVGVAYVD